MSDEANMIHPPNTCVVLRGGIEVARVPVEASETAPGEYSYQLPALELGSYLVELIYVPPGKPALTVQRGGGSAMPADLERKLRDSL